MVFPKVAKILYFVLTGMSIVFAFATLTGGAIRGMPGIVGFIVFLVAAVIYPLLIRIFFEVMLILFKIYEKLDKL